MFGTGFAAPAIVVERPIVAAASTSVSFSMLSFFKSPAAFAAPLPQSKARRPLLFLREMVKLEIGVLVCKDLSHSICPKVSCLILSNFLTDFQVFFCPL